MRRVRAILRRVRFSNLKNCQTRIQNFWNRSGVAVWKIDSSHLWWTGSGLDIFQDTCDFFRTGLELDNYFEKNWIRRGSGDLFDFYNEITLRVIQDWRKWCYSSNVTVAHLQDWWCVGTRETSPVCFNRVLWKALRKKDMVSFGFSKRNLLVYGTLPPLLNKPIMEYGFHNKTHGKQFKDSP